MPCSATRPQSKLRRRIADGHDRPRADLFDDTFSPLQHGPVHDHPDGACRLQVQHQLHAPRQLHRYFVRLANL